MQAFSPKSDVAACLAMMRGGSRSFFAASRLLPRRVAEPATALYAFCRLADDAIDDGAAKHEALAALRVRLDRAYAGAPCDHPADRAFAATVARHDIPRVLPLALLEGFAWDADGRRYRTLDELFDYAARVAGSVGAMMAVLMGARTAGALARACDLGVAMQLTNIARDLGEDARAGRLYLPLDWLCEARLCANDVLGGTVADARLARLVDRLLQVAGHLYARGFDGIAALPMACRPGIRAAGLIYADIGRVLTCNGDDCVRSRAQVPGVRKAVLLARSVVPQMRGAARLSEPALPACAYLVEAAAVEISPVRASNTRIDWVFDLFERLDDQQWETS